MERRNFLPAAGLSLTALNSALAQPSAPPSRIKQSVCRWVLRQDPH